MAPKKSDTTAEPQVRVVVYMPATKHRKLKSVLALQGDSVSEWFRNKADKEIEGK